MAKDKRKIVAGIGVVGLLTGLGIALSRAQAAPPVPPENVELSGLLIEPSQVYVEESVSISVLATNLGGVAGSYEVVCEVI